VSLGDRPPLPPEVVQGPPQLREGTASLRARAHRVGQAVCQRVPPVPILFGLPLSHGLHTALSDKAALSDCALVGPSLGLRLYIIEDYANLGRAHRVLKCHGIPAYPYGGSGYYLPNLNARSGLQPADARFRPY
jgi:hypothetical protein